ncbi:hypothetical protein RI367_003228 [Sorochytrium milnesiophthora]
MARDDVCTGDHIGIPDGEISEDCTRDLADITVSRVGGPACYPAALATKPAPRCGNCNSALFLVARLHCPLEKCPDRINYLWGCNSATCAAKPGSWTAFRIQAPRRSRKSKPSRNKTSNAASAPTDVSFEFKVDSSAWLEDGGAPATDSEGFDWFAAEGNAQVPSDDCWALPPELATKDKTAIQVEQESLDAIDHLATTVDQLALGGNQQEADAHPSFPAHYIAFEEEYIRSKLAKVEDDLRHLGQLSALLSEAGSALEAGSSSTADFDLASEEYENTVVRGYDRRLRKFLDRIEENPEQVVRYRFGGSPLLFGEHEVVHSAAVSKDGSAKRVPACERCGAERTFEYQVLSTLLSTLPVEQYAVTPVNAAAASATITTANHQPTWSAGMEFGTVLVYTCRNNCTGDKPNDDASVGWSLQQEPVVLSLQLLKVHPADQLVSAGMSGKVDTASAGNRSSLIPSAPSPQRPLSPHPQIYQVDFGLARSAGVQSAAEPAPAPSSPRSVLTSVASRLLRTVRSKRRQRSPNFIKTSKYTLLTFLPLNLFSQFRRLYNLYFLLGAIFSLVDIADAPISPIAEVSPLVVVLAISALKDALEDYARYQADKVANTATSTVIRDGQLVSIPSMDLAPGDLVYVTKGEKVRADIVLLGTTGEDCTCYIETSELDGETALKRRSGLQQLAHLTNPAETRHLTGRIRCESPNENLSKFEGTLLCTTQHDGETQKDTPGKEYSLNLDQFLPRGIFLRNTDSAIGVVVYVGHDTKIFRNLRHTGLKYSTLEGKVNRFVLFAFAYNAILLVATMIMEYSVNSPQIWYLSLIDYLNPTSKTYIVSFMVSFIIYSYIIPTSLFVMIEVVRVAQRQFMIWDTEMQSAGGISMKVNNSNLNEDLGGVKYVFSDKTGTLTRNQMNLSRIYVDNVVYNEEAEPGGFVRALRDPHTSDSHREALRQFALNLLVCNGVVPSLEPGQPLQDVLYEAQSPDETALLTGMKHNEMYLRLRQKSSVTLSLLGEETTYTTLLSVDFDSDRKRMTTLIRYQDRIVALMKGADNIIISRLRSDEPSGNIAAAEQQLRGFSELGLRTLMFAWKDVSDEQYEAFRYAYDEAQNALNNRQQRVGEVCDAFEKGFRLLGVSAIEDRLQDCVPETIDFLLKSDIHVWLLTGDKQETAINIGYSSKLLNQRMIVLTLDRIAAADLGSRLDGYLDATANVTRQGREVALIVQGETLELIFEHHPLKFLQLGQRCRSVICCRVTPLQKALVVRLVKRELRVLTLSIGDGANDVSMIQEAHIGVGIQGVEGGQAVRASDYAFVEFKCLARLLCVHGRYSYLRLTKMILYTFYKNIMLISIQLLFGIHSLWSGSTVYNGSFLTTWNVVSTVAPPLFLGCFEKDVPEEHLMTHPQLYQPVANGLYWNTPNLIKWALLMIWDTFVVYLIGINFQAADNVHATDGMTLDLDVLQWVLGITVLNVALAKMAMSSRHWVWVTWAGFAVSYSLYEMTFGALEIMSIISLQIGKPASDDLPVGTYVGVHTYAIYYLAGLIAPVISSLPHLVYYATVYPDDRQILAELSKLKQQPVVLAPHDVADKHEEVGSTSIPVIAGESTANMVQATVVTTDRDKRLLYAAARTAHNTPATVTTGATAMSNNASLSPSSSSAASARSPAQIA